MQSVTLAFIVVRVVLLVVCVDYWFKPNGMVLGDRSTPQIERSATNEQKQPPAALPIHTTKVRHCDDATGCKPGVV